MWIWLAHSRLRKVWHTKCGRHAESGAVTEHARLQCAIHAVFSAHILAADSYTCDSAYIPFPPRLPSPTCRTLSRLPPTRNALRSKLHLSDAAVIEHGILPSTSGGAVKRLNRGSLQLDRASRYNGHRASGQPSHHDDAHGPDVHKYGHGPG